MLKPFLTTLFAVTATVCFSQDKTFNRQQLDKTTSDSVTIRVHPVYDSVSNIHRKLIGENYRKDWAIPVKVPVIRFSSFMGGLTPVKEGGGLESKSLRMVDKTGKEWVLRSVEKSPDKLLPQELRETIARDVLEDALSQQHPFSALIVPPLADAAGIPHATPIIGVVATDPNLGEYNKFFSGLLCLVEEREPSGKSDNTPKTKENLVESNINRVDGTEFLKARMLDLLIGDWDRHEDQWRWAVNKNGKGKYYTAVPRDRDQVFHINEGVIPSLAALPFIDPLLQDFSGDIRHPKYAIYKTNFMNMYPDMQFSHERWMQIVKEFIAAETDDVLEAGLKRLPPEMYKLRHAGFLKILKERRQNIPAAMDEFYHFIYKIIDIRASNDNEYVNIKDTTNGKLNVSVYRLTKKEKLADTLMSVSYDPGITKEIRLYVSGGDDHVVINNAASPIRLRLIGGDGNKEYHIEKSVTRVKLYDKKGNAKFDDSGNRLSKHLSNDTSNTEFIPTYLYNVVTPLLTADINKDDGFLLGIGFRNNTQGGFRKKPYTTSQELMITHSFSTDAFKIYYDGLWIKAIGKTDFNLQLQVDAPDNVMNFFGRGNNTPLDKTGDYHKFYRARFNMIQLDPEFRWHTDTATTISLGPSLQYYHADPADNHGRFIDQQTGLINSYDSTSVNQNRAHIGLVAKLVSDKRDNKILPTKRFLFNLNISGYAGLNSNSLSFGQLKADFTYFQSVTANNALVLSDRIGGGVTIGNAAFYQSLFLGGQGNLLGYLQNRFAGQQMLYDDFSARLRLTEVRSYILPGELGLKGIYNIGRVWVDNENSNTWHQGVGGGIYFSPVHRATIELIAAHSVEGWYPYISFDFTL